MIIQPVLFITIFLKNGLHLTSCNLRFQSEGHSLCSSHIYHLDKTSHQYLFYVMFCKDDRCELGEYFTHRLKIGGFKMIDVSRATFPPLSILTIFSI